MNDNIENSTIITMKVNVVSLEAVQQFIIDACSKKKNSKYICVSNVHMCIEVYRNDPFASIVNGADLVIPDGKPIALAQRLLGHSNAEQVRGFDITEAICKVSELNGLKIGFYGGSSDQLLEKVVSNLSSKYPYINIVYTYSPPFRPLTYEEDVKVINDINSSGVDVLFVGIGCPKQENWMAEHRSSLKCVMLGVGAVFDFLAGEKRLAPEWMQKVGLEWLFRLCSEPRRLWFRYLTTNPYFLYLLLVQVVSKIRNKKSGMWS